MRELDELLLLSGQDIPFFGAQLQIHVPRLKDIAVIGEKNFYEGCGILNLDKDVLDEAVGKIDLEKVTNFDIIMMMLQSSNQPEIQILKANVIMVLAVLFPTYNIQIEKNQIVLKNLSDEASEKDIRYINRENYQEFQNLIQQILCLNLGNKGKNYNTGGNKLANKIAEKLKKGRKKAASAKGEDISGLLARYVSILAVGQQKDMNDLLNYTLYQLFEEYQRYTLKTSFDMNIQARLAGATKIEEPKNWMENLKDESLSSF